MANIINSKTTGTGGVDLVSVDTTGDLNIQSGGVTKIAVTSAGAAITGTLSATSTVSDATGTLRPLVSGTAQATNTGATSYEFTGIPSWVKRITVMFNGNTRNATTVQVIQIGSGSFTTSGYVGASWPAAGGAVGNSNGFGFAGNNLGTDLLYGIMTISNITGNTWVAGCQGAVNQANLAIGGGSVTISGTLDRVRLTTLSTTATFTGGTINILYE